MGTIANSVTEPPLYRRDEAADLIQARVVAYRVLADIIARGLSPELMPFVKASPLLTDAVRDWFAALPIDGPDPFDMAAAAHQKLFGFGVFSHQSAFLDPSGLLGGRQVDRLRRFYDRCGLSPKGEDADHLATILRVLAVLSEAQLDADVPAHTRWLREAQGELLDAHLLTWVPAWVLAVRQEGDPVFSAVAELTLELLMDHRDLLPSAPFEDGDPGEATDDLDALLDNPRTSLRTLSETLVVAGRTGFWLSRRAIESLARQHDIPRGFGERRLMLQNLLKSAAEYDVLVDVVDALEVHVQQWTDHFSDLGAAHGALLASNAEWLDKLSRTRTLLGKLRSGAIAVNAPEAEPPAPES